MVLNLCERFPLNVNAWLQESVAWSHLQQSITSWHLVIWRTRINLCLWQVMWWYINESLWRYFLWRIQIMDDSVHSWYCSRFYDKYKKYAMSPLASGSSYLFSIIFIAYYLPVFFYLHAYTIENFPVPIFAPISYWCCAETPLKNFKNYIHWLVVY